MNGGAAVPALVGADALVPLVTGGTTRYINLDYAASTPPLVEVARAVDEFLPWYSSVHRGAGFKSQVATAAYEGAREAVRAFFHAPVEDPVIFVRNTTDAVNLLATSLPPGAQVFAFSTEHHANMLPWRRPSVSVTYLPAPRSPDDVLQHLEDALVRSSGPYRLVTMTGASNVTGEVWPAAAVATLAHRHGARVFLDGAQLAAHHRVDLGASGVDFFAVSAHKMYAPYGAGALIGPADWLSLGEPYLRGGGAVEFVTLDDVFWSPVPERQEAGSPNVIGAVAMAAACLALGRYGMDRVEALERELGDYARRRICAIPGIETYALWDASAARLGIVTFNVKGYWHSQVSAVLSAEHGIGVRHGCFCAHPLMLKLLDVRDREAAMVRADIERADRHRTPGAVRVSLGLGSCREDVDRLCRALEAVVASGPRWDYALDRTSGEFHPVPDNRRWPAMHIALTPSASRLPAAVVTSSRVCQDRA